MTARNDTAGSAGLEVAFTPTPPAASALVLRATKLDHGQVAIENGPGTLGGEFDRYYVHLSGYVGEHNPEVFAAAPDLRNALHNLAGQAGGLRAFEHEIRAIVGNTNWRCLCDAITAADAALSRAGKSS